MTDNRGKPLGEARARLRRALGIGLVSALALAIVAIAVPSPGVPASPTSGGRSVVAAGEHHAVLAVGSTRLRTDGVAGLGFAFARRGAGRCAVAPPGRRRVEARLARSPAALAGPHGGGAAVVLLTSIPFPPPGGSATDLEEKSTPWCSFSCCITPWRPQPSRR